MNPSRSHRRSSRNTEVLLALALALILASCSGGSTAANPINDTAAPGAEQPASTATTQAPTPVEAAESTAAETSPAESALSTPIPVPSSTPEPAVSASAQPDAEPVWITKTGDASFTSSEYGRVWDVELLGLLQTTGASDDGCHVLFGTMRRGSGSDVIAGYKDAPDFGYVLADGDYQYPVARKCSTGGLTLAGYDNVNHAEVTEGTAYAFFVEFDTGVAPDAVVIGRPSGDVQLELNVAVTSDIERPDLDQSERAALRDLVPLTTPNLQWATSGTNWSLTVDGIVDRSTGCVVVVGTMTPTTSGEGVLAGFGDQPRFGLIVDGRYQRPPFSGYDCLEQESQAAGYRSPSLTDIAVGTDFAFYESFSLSDEYTIDALVIGQAGRFDDALLLEPTSATAFPLASAAATTSESTYPPLTGAMATAKKQWTTWDVRLNGLVDVGPPTSGQGRCMIVYGTMAWIEFEGTGTVNSQYEVPTVGLLQDGTLVRGTRGEECPQQSVATAGYRSLQRLNITRGTVHSFYEVIAAPDGPLEGVVVESDDRDDGLIVRPDENTGGIGSPDTSWSSANPLATTRLAGARYEHLDGIRTFTYEIDRIDELPAIGEHSAAGRCYALFGVVTPNVLAPNESMSDPADAPPINPITSSGYLLPRDGSECQLTDAQRAGHGSLSKFVVAEGTNYPFVVTFYVPSSEDIAMVAVGRAIRPTRGTTPAVYLAAEFD